MAGGTDCRKKSPNLSITCVSDLILTRKDGYHIYKYQICHNISPFHRVYGSYDCEILWKLETWKIIIGIIAYGCIIMPFGWINEANSHENRRKWEKNGNGGGY